MANYFVATIYLECQEYSTTTQAVTAFSLLPFFGLSRVHRWPQEQKVATLHVLHEQWGCFLGKTKTEAKEQIKGAIRAVFAAVSPNPRRAPPDVYDGVVAFLTEEAGPEWVSANLVEIERVVWGPEMGAPLTDYQARMERWWYAS